MLNKLHPDASLVLIGRGLIVRDADMERNIGRRIRFQFKGGWKPSLGTAVRDCNFIIGGVQKIHDGTLAYRVFEEREGEPDTFGRPAKPDEILFLDTIESAT